MTYCDREIVIGIFLVLTQQKLSEVGFEPTPTFVDQNAHSYECKITLESGALDHSAILTCYYCNFTLYITLNKASSLHRNIHTVTGHVIYE